jgi:hypothetical protein
MLNPVFRTRAAAGIASLTYSSRHKHPTAAISSAVGYPAVQARVIFLAPDRVWMRDMDGRSLSILALI